MHSPRYNDAEDLRKSYGILRTKNDRNEDKLSELRDKLKEVRTELGSKERQLESARKLLARVGAEKSQLSAQSEQRKAQSRKLEHRLSQAPEVEELQSKLVHQRSKTEELRRKLQESTANLLIADETVHRSTKEINVLKGALGLQKDYPRGASDNQAKLLHQLAQSQEDSTSLAVELSENQRQKQNLSARLKGAEREVERLLQVRLDLEAQKHEATRQAQEALNISEDLRRDADQVRADLRRTSSTLDEALVSKLATEQQLRTCKQELSVETAKTEQLSERLSTVERAGRLSIEALRTEVTLAVERAESRATEQRAAWQVKEATLKELCTELRDSLDESRVKDSSVKELCIELMDSLDEYRVKDSSLKELCIELMDSLDEYRVDHETESLQLRRRIEEIEQQLEESRTSEITHHGEIGILRGQLESLEGMIMGKSNNK
eukprot:gene20142-26874_t